jgi:DNA topoisomerase IB
MLEFGDGLPTAREVVAEHLQQRGLSQERALAAAFRMLDVGYLAWHYHRIGGTGRTTERARCRPSWTPTARKRAVAAAIKDTSIRLGNTPAVARRAYVNPRVVDLFGRDITIAAAVAKARKVFPDCYEDEIAVLAAAPVVERAVLDLLR